MIKRLILLIFIFLGLYYIYDHNYFDSQQFVRDVKKEIYLPAQNDYVKSDADFSFVKMTNDFFPNNKQELLDIYYTVLNSGWDNFTFYCDYDECISDVNDISTDTNLISNLNSFVNPYNQYSTISTYTTPLLNGKVNIKVEKSYDTLMIAEINSKVDEITKELNLSNYDIRKQIELVHDYIVNNTKYDALKIDNIYDDTYHSGSAYGPLFEGYAVCSGYSDLMAIFLEKMGVLNVRVASAKHVWNLVYLNNKWYHLDLTWDDPYSENGVDTTSYNFFLIDYSQMQKWRSEEHNFDKNVYQEAL